MENPVITAQQQLATMLLAGDEGYVVQFPDGSIADANDAFCRMAGLTHADLLAGSAAWQHHPDDEARVQAILQGHPRGDIGRHELQRPTCGRTARSGGPRSASPRCLMRRVL